MMKSEKISPNPMLKVATPKVNMIFRPKNIIEKQQLQTSLLPDSSKQSSSILSWLKSPKAKSNKNCSPETSASMSRQSSSLESSYLNRNRSQPLKFIKNLSYDHYLIGNGHQLDCIGFGAIAKSGFIQVEYLWSINLKKKIDLVAVQEKKFNVLSLVSDAYLYVYKYEYKKIQNLPILVSKIYLGENPSFLKITKDSTITVLFQKRFQVYTTNDKVRKKLSKPYEIQDIKGQINLLIVPKAFNSTLNLFFEEKVENKKTFPLWTIQIEYLPNEIKISKPQKVYEIKNSLRQTLIIKNYSRDIFLMNLGSEIFALKKGYILDSATVNMKNEESRLFYYGQDTLLHISASKVEVYNFSLRLESKPFRIFLNPKDSIHLSKTLKSEQFFEIVETTGNNFAIFFQKSPQYNMLKKEEVEYSFYLTRPLSRKEKIEELFGKDNISKLLKDPSKLNEVCDMAEKMGLSIKQIYLELWNRSEKTEKDDYLLLCTRDYETIQNGICRKLKKSSMPFKQIKKIEDDCFNMLEKQLFSPNCTEEVIIQYISSHFFRRKLLMFKDQFLMKVVEGCESTEGKQKLMITIKQYQYLKEMQLKNELRNLVQTICFDQKGRQSAVIKMRLLIKNFKFVLRTIYFQLLQIMIITAKNELLTLLNEIPQILPYEFEEVKSSGVPEFYDGIWSEIDQREWKQNLILDSITTFQNKEIMNEKVIKGIWFRRYELSQHDLVTDSPSVIKKNWEQLRTSNTFYFFIEKVLLHITDQDIVKEIINLIEEKYKSQVPEKIKGNIFLFYKMFLYLSQKQILPIIDDSPSRFSQFLKMELHEIFRHLFLKERSSKGLLLKEIKPLCDKSSPQGHRLFNKGLLQYFSSDISEVSDLKYILNRINNLKIEFHRENQEMYEVLVEGLERKLKIGTDSDIPIQQVLIYIENIPLRINATKNQPQQNVCKALQELKSVEKINSQIETLRSAKLGMSLYDILHSSEQVLTKLVDHEIKFNRMMEMNDSSQQSRSKVENITYRLIAKIQNLSEEIYDNPNSSNIFFILLSKLCEEETMIKHAKNLLENEYLSQCYDESTAQCLVQYMYRWKLFQNKKIVKNQVYIRELLTLIPITSVIHQYISAQLQFSKMLSTSSMVQFPISESAPTVWDVKEIIDRLPIEEVLEIDIEKVYEAVITMQRIVNEEMEEDFQQAKPLMTINQAYEIIFIKLMKCRKLKEVLNVIKKIFTLPTLDSTYNIVYPLIYIIEITNELNSANTNSLLKCISHYFYEPQALLNIVQTLTNYPFTILQRADYINERLRDGKEKYQGFQDKNMLFKAQTIECLRENPGCAEQFMHLLSKSTQHLQQAKEEFQKISYPAIMIMLYNSPYALAKYINCMDALNLKFLRSFLSYLVQLQIFDPIYILEFGRRIFLIILYVLRQKIPIQIAINEYSKIPLDEEIEVKIDTSQWEDDDFEFKLWRSVEAFSRKKIKLKTQMIDKVKSSENLEDGKSVFTNQMEKIRDISQQEEPPSYPFEDSDDEDAGNNLDIRKTGRKKSLTPIFEPNEERNQLLNRKSKNLFVSAGVGCFKKSNQFTAYIRKSKKGSQTLCYEDFYEWSKASFKKEDKVSEKVHDDIGIRSSLPSLELAPHIFGENREGRSSSPNIRVTQSYEIKPDECRRQPSFYDSNQLRPEVSNSVELGGSSRRSSEISNPYRIDIKHIEESDDDDSQIQIRICDSKQLSPCQTPLVRRRRKEEEDNLGKTISKFLKQNEENIERDENQLNYQALEGIKEDIIQFRQFVKEIYENNKNEKINKEKILKVLKQINKDFSILNLNDVVLQIYTTAEKYQTKFMLELPFDEIFVTDGLFRMFVDKDQIFQFIYPNIKNIVDEYNVHKISRMIVLVFKRTNFQPKIIFDYLCRQIENYPVQKDEIQMQRYLEKMSVLVGKLQLQTLLSNMNELKEKIRKVEDGGQLIKLIINEVRKRKGDESEKKEFLSRLQNSQNDINE